MITDSIRKYYKKTLAENGPDAQGMGWRNKESQEVRFQQLVKVFYTEAPFSVNDLGCGAGHLFDFLLAHFGNVEYDGYDLMEEMIVEANRRIEPMHNVKFHLIQSARELKDADYSVASGIFNLKFDRTENQWKEYILETLGLLNQKSKKGFSFNALTRYSDKELMKPELYYTDPLWLFDYCKLNFAKNVALLHDYSQYDFTILVKKNF